MLNYIWSGMLFLGIIWGTFHGRLAQVTEGALNAAGEAVTLSITMLGIVVFWNGILEIGSRAGRTAFRKNETGFEIPLSGSAARL